VQLSTGHCFCEVVVVDSDIRVRCPADGLLDPRVRQLLKQLPDPRLSLSIPQGFALLECFSGERQALGIFELADMVGMTKSTTHRYAATLVALGCLEQGAKRKYRLSSGAAGPGSEVIRTIRAQVRAGVALEELRNVVGYTVSMGVLHESRVVYVSRLFGHRRGQYVIDMGLCVGAEVPVYCTALGKVLLVSLSEPERRELLSGLDLVPCGPRSVTVMGKLVAELDRINVREVVVSDEEFVSGARSIAVFVPRPRSEYPVAIEVTVPSIAYTVKRLVEDIGPRLERAARLISGE
jgi:IclR family transcriptional regulator, pca regulon regulatory protein